MDETKGEEKGFSEVILTASILCNANLHHRANFRAGR